jgi:hypothetical protein
MRSFRRLRLPVAAFAAAAFACAQAIPATSSSFTATTGNSGNLITAASSWGPPTVGTRVAQKSLGGAANSIRPGGTFYVYANVTDTDTISSVTASVANIATVSSASMTAGSYTVAGTSYNYRSALLTAKSTLSTTSYTWSLTATNAGGYTSSAASSTVSVNATTFDAADFAWDDGGSTTGRFEPGETVRWVFERDGEPDSIVAGWDGSPMDVRFVLADKTPAGTTQDAVGLMSSTSSTLLPVGKVLLGASDFAASGAVIYFNGSTMTVSGNALIVTLGTWDAAASSKTVITWTPFAWIPDATPWDLFGNIATTTTATSFAPTAFNATNKTGGITGQAEAGDTIGYTFNKAPVPSSILAGWSGGATSVTVKLSDKATSSAFANDYVQVYDSQGNVLPLGPVQLVAGDYISSGTISYTNSTMTLSGTKVSITLGTASGTARRDTNTGRKPLWAPDPSILDAYGAGVLPIPLSPSVGSLQF